MPDQNQVDRWKNERARCLRSNGTDILMRFCLDTVLSRGGRTCKSTSILSAGILPPFLWISLLIVMRLRCQGERPTHRRAADSGEYIALNMYPPELYQRLQTTVSSPQGVSRDM